jgi:hypothetical protein
MTRILIVLIALAVALMVFSLVDAIALDRFRVRGVPKGLWIVLIVLLPLVGSVLWLTVGRGKKNAPGAHRGQRAPDDDIDFLRGLNTDPPSDGPRA